MCHIILNIKYINQTISVVVPPPRSSDHLMVLEPADIVLLPLKTSNELGQLHIFLAFVQEQWVGTARHLLTVPGAPDTCLINVRTAQFGEHQNCAIVGKIPELLHTDGGQDAVYWWPDNDLQRSLPTPTILWFCVKKVHHLETL